MCLVQRAHEISQRRPEHPLHRPRLGRDDMNLDLAMPQSGGRFEPDEARADNDGAAPFPGASDQIAAVGERAQRPHMRQFGTRHLQPDRLGAGRQQQLVETERLAVTQHDAAARDIERRRRHPEVQLPSRPCHPCRRPAACRMHPWAQVCRRPSPRW